MSFLSRFAPDDSDYVKPSKRNYWGCELEVKLIKASDIIKQKNVTEAVRNILIKGELSGIEHIDYVLELDSTNKDAGRITTRQLVQILNDMGFNVSYRLVGTHDCDISAIMNIKGFVWPFWNKMPDLFDTRMEKLLLSKWAPGKERLHIRAYENNDGKWLITSHIDINWINPNILKVIHAHSKTAGAGDYKLGTVMAYKLIKEFIKVAKTDKIFTYDNIITIVKKVYKTGTDKFYSSL